MSGKRSLKDIFASATYGKTGTGRAGIRRLLPVLPALAMLAFFFFLLLFALYRSFTRYSLFTSGAPKFAGLVNYRFILNDPTADEKLVVTLKFVLLALITEVPLGFAVALLLDQQIGGIKVLRTVILMPMMVPLLVAALMWRTMMAPVEGVLNYGLSLVGLPGSAWLGSANSALPSILLIDIWTHIPFVALILLAGLQGLPREPYEAAKVDGASWWQLFWHVTVPLMSPFIALVSMFRAIEAFRVFDIIFATTKGGPGRATTTLHIEAYKEGFTHGNMGIALSYVVILTFLIAITATVLRLAWRRASKIREE